MRDFSKAKRIVIKIGTNTLSKEGGVDSGYFWKIARQVSGLIKEGRQVVIITSGAIGMGAGQIVADYSGSDAKKFTHKKLRKSCEL